MLYPARGTATVWEGSGYEATPDSHRRVRGPARARLLDALRSPATTSALALRFGVTPSAFSQYLALLHCSGVADGTHGAGYYTRLPNWGWPAAASVS